MAKEEEELDLDEMLEALSPETVQKKVRKKDKGAYKTFDHEGLPDIVDYVGFREQVIKYVRHHTKAVGYELPEDLAFSKAMAILEANRQGGGFKGAFKRAREGNLVDVIKELADGLEQEHVHAYTQHKLSEIDPLDYETHRKIAAKMIEKYRPLVEDSKSPDELASEYEGLLHMHGQLVDSVKREYKKYKPLKKAA